MEKRKLKKEKGVTLIALVVTIIVLLILAGISINAILGDNGLISSAKDAKEKTEQDAINSQIDRDTLYNQLVSSRGDENTETDGSGDTGNEEEIIPKITFTYSIPLNQWTNSDVTVIANLNTEKYTVQTSIDGQAWTGANTQTRTKNGKVYAKIMNGTTQVGDIFETEVTNIDKTPPEAGKLIVTKESDGSICTFNENNRFSTCVPDRKQIYKYEIKLVNGSDIDSGHKKTTYSIDAETPFAIKESYENLTESISLYGDGYDPISLEGAETWVSNNKSFDIEPLIKLNNGIKNAKNYQYIPVGSYNYEYIKYNIVVSTEDNAGNISTETYIVEIGIIPY